MVLLIKGKVRRRTLGKIKKTFLLKWIRLRQKSYWTVTQASKDKIWSLQQTNEWWLAVFIQYRNHKYEDSHKENVVNIWFSWLWHRHALYWIPKQKHKLWIKLIQSTSRPNSVGGRLRRVFQRNWDQISRLSLHMYITKASPYNITHK